MKTYKKRIKKILAFYREKTVIKQILLVIAVMAVLTTAVSSQTNVKKTARNEGSKGGEIKIQEKIPPQSNRIEQQQVIQFNDHHTHIWSLNASTHVTAPLLPTVELPEDLSRLLREREKGWNDKAALADLYTEDVVMLTA
jgi:hypothetical protein